MANIIEITDFEAPELDVFTRLTENQLLNRHEPEKGMFIAESPKVIERALAAGCRPAAFLAEKGRVRGESWDIVERFEGLPVFTAEFDVLSKMTGYNRDASRVAILENVVNPTNVGAIFRSAAALNIDAVLLTTDCSNPLYRRSIRVSMGTVFQIPWAFVDKELSWPEEGLKKLKMLGFRTAALALSDDSVSIDDPKLMSEEKLALILGTEGDGLASSTIADCDYTVRIPMSHGVDSLNVAAASAVAFWQLGKRK